MRTSKKLSVALLVLPLAFTGCASETRRVSNVAVQVDPTDNPEEAIAGLRSQIDGARKAEVGLLSPTWFASAEKSLKRAEELRADGGDTQAMFKSIAEGRAQIQRAEQISEVTRKAVPDVLKAREAAYSALDESKAAGATNLTAMTDELKAADGKFRDLAILVEDDKMNLLEKRKGAVVEAYAGSKNISLRKEKLDTARRIVEQAKKQNAGKYAPKALALAEESIEGTDRFIKANPGSLTDIEKRGDEAIFYAKRALVLTERGKVMDDMKPEDRAVYMETTLFSLGQTMNAPDKRDNSFDVQIDTLKNLAQQNYAGAKGAETASQAAIVNTTANSDLKDKDAKFRKISESFTREEAEVFRQGDSLVLRLRGIKFPSGEAKLGPENFAVLQKVVTALSDFPASQVTVEGHTDSVGGREANLKLSQHRADAVREFLVAANAVPEGKVSAKGLAFERPIASNKSDTGRAANRRIDIVVGTSDRN